MSIVLVYMHQYPVGFTTRLEPLLGEGIEVPQNYLLKSNIDVLTTSNIIKNACRVQIPEGYAYPFPDLLTFHDTPTPIEHTLFEMHLKHRMRAFQGTFHAKPITNIGL